MDDTAPRAVRHLDRPGGRVAYDVAGQGPLVLLVPGMGDLRSTYRHLVPALRGAGYRVAVGGERRVAVSVPAVLVGSSMGAGAAVWAAAERPDLVLGLVLVGPFVRDPNTGAAARRGLRLAMTPLWAATVWKSYLPRLYAGTRPADFDAHRDQVVASLRRPGYARAFSRTTRVGHAEAAARLGQVRSPALVVMGALDPDFPSPADEAEWVAGRLGGRVEMVPGAGHYPHSQRPDLTAAAVLDFLARVGTGA